MQTDRVSLEAAKFLADVGYDKQYGSDDSCYGDSRNELTCVCDAQFRGEGYVLAPSLYDAMRYLRNEKSVFIVVSPWRDGCHFNIYDLRTPCVGLLDSETNCRDSYEDATDAAIIAACKYILNGGLPSDDEENPDSRLWGKSRLKPRDEYQFWRGMTKQKKSWEPMELASKRISASDNNLIGERRLIKPPFRVLVENNDPMTNYAIADSNDIPLCWGVPSFETAQHICDLLNREHREPQVAGEIEERFKMTAWVARDESGELWLYRDENVFKDNSPFTCHQNQWRTVECDPIELDGGILPSVKWEDDKPTEVEITIKVKQ